MSDEVSGNPPADERPDFDRLMDMADELVKWRDEPLHPDLQEWVEENGPLGAPMLRHPLVYEMFLSLPGQTNRAYLRKKELLAEAIAESDWHTVVFLHERPYRLEALVEYVTGRWEDGSLIALDELDLSQDALDLVADVWVDSENIEQHIEDWRLFFGQAEHWFLGTIEERAAFDALPDPIRAYRAGIDDGDWSWSTKRGIAEFFARRFRDSELEVIEADIPKSRCFGYLTRRGEHELLVRVSGNEE